MVQDVIDRLVAGTHADPDGGPLLRVATRAVVIAKSAISRGCRTRVRRSP